MQLISQNPTDKDFIQDPYKFYKNFVSNDRLYFWREYNMPAVFVYAGQEMLFRDKRFGRENLKNQSKYNEKHLTDFTLPINRNIPKLIDFLIWKFILRLALY